MQENNIISIGIDVSKDKLDICLLTKDKPIFTIICNNLEGFNSLKEKIGNTKAPIIVESTGCYHLNCVLYLQDNKFNVKLINPIISKAYSKAALRKTKTDKIDARVIAEIGLKEKDLKSFTETREQIQLKQRLRLLEYLKTTRSQYKNKIKGLKEMSMIDVQLEINILTNLIKNLTKQMHILSKEILSNEWIKEIFNNTGKIIGVSDIMFAGIIIELGDIERFKNSKSVVGFAGLDPSIKQSGISVNVKGSISKRGSNTLRGILFKVAWGLFMHNKNFRRFYDKKRAEGKHYYTCLIATARKFLVVLFNIIKNKKMYNIDFSI